MSCVWGDMVYLIDLYNNTIAEPERRLGRKRTVKGLGEIRQLHHWQLREYIMHTYRTVPGTNQSAVYPLLLPFSQRIT
jgi:hypothetical protein